MPKVQMECHEFEATYQVARLINRLTAKNHCQQHITRPRTVSLL